MQLRNSILVAVFVSLVAWINALGDCPRDHLRLAEVRFAPAENAPPFVKIVNAGAEPAELRGVEIAANPTTSYVIPNTLTELLDSEGIVVIVFDGLDASKDDLSFSGDKLVVLHAPAAAAPSLVKGTCSLYRFMGGRTTDFLDDFVAYGAEPGEAVALAMQKNIWSSPSTYLHTSPDDLLRGPSAATRVTPGASIGRDNSGRWQIFRPDEVQMLARSKSALRGPALAVPGANASLPSTPQRFLWEITEATVKSELQIAGHTDFTDVVQSAVIIGTNDFFPSFTLPAGTYYWRVRSLEASGAASPWSLIFKFDIIAPPAAPAANSSSGSLHSSVHTSAASATYPFLAVVYDQASHLPLPGVSVTVGSYSAVTDSMGDFTINGLIPGSYTATLSLKNFQSTTINFTIASSPVSLAIPLIGDSGGFNVVPAKARKETTMLAITRSLNGDHCNRFGPNQQWDIPLPRATVNPTDLESYWCWAVSSHMINRYYGGTITNDEVVLAIKDDLLHDADAGALDSECIKSLNYALGESSEVINSKPTAAMIVAWLNAGRPMFLDFAWTGAGYKHIVTVDHYEYQADGFYVRYVNIDNNGRTQLVNWDKLTVDGGSTAFSFALIPSAHVANPIKTDPLLFRDSDGDGINDYDEIARFTAYYKAHGAKGALNPSSRDTDNDKIDDKTEIASWVFPSTGFAFANIVLNTPDIDHDGKYPELDEDTDGGGLKDGEEDTNFNGSLDDKETDVYDPKDDGVKDIVFCIDTTGSMGPYINQVKANATNIINKVASEDKNYRFALVEYKDHPDGGGDPGDFPARVDQSFTDDSGKIISAIDGLGAAGGGDAPEAVYSGLITCIDGISGWRQGDGVKRSIILFGDAPAHDPEPVTGYTLGSVVAKAEVGGITTSTAPTTSALHSRAAEPSAKRSGPIRVYGLNVGFDDTARASFSRIATGTGGKLVQAPNASDVPAAVLEVLDSISASPSAVLDVTDKAGTPATIGKKRLTASLQKSFDADQCGGILIYDFDWDGDGTYDESSATPVLSHRYPEGFKGIVRGRINTVSGTTATATFTTSANVTDALPTLQTISAPILDPQTGLFVQKVTVLNPSTTPITGVKVVVDGLSDGASLYNASGTTEAGLPYREKGKIIPPGGTMNIKLEYYLPTRLIPTLNLTLAFTPSGK